FQAEDGIRDLIVTGVQTCALPIWRVLHHRRAPTLLKLLDDPDEPTRDAALGALIALGDRRAVSALTRSRSLRDRHEMRKIIEAKIGRASCRERVEISVGDAVSKHK